MAEGAEGQFPAFPRLGGEQSVRITRERRFRAWVGRPDRLESLERIVEQALERRYKDYVATLTQGDADALRQARIAAERLQLGVVVTGGSGRLRRTGNVTAVLAEMDPREVEEVIMSNASWDPEFPSVQVKLSVGRGFGRAEPIELKVTGADRQWVAGVFENIGEELAKQVPKWAFLRAPFVSAVLGCLVALGVLGGLVATNEALADDPAVVAVLGAGLGFVGLLSLGMGVFPPIMLKAFPGLEIVEAGGTAQGRLVLGLLFTVFTTGMGIAGLALGVLAL